MGWQLGRPLCPPALLVSSSPSFHVSLAPSLPAPGPEGSGTFISLHLPLVGGCPHRCSGCRPLFLTETVSEQGWPQSLFGALLSRHRAATRTFTLGSAQLSEAQGSGSGAHCRPSSAWHSLLTPTWGTCRAVALWTHNKLSSRLLGDEEFTVDLSEQLQDLPFGLAPGASGLSSFLPAQWHQGTSRQPPGLRGLGSRQFTVDLPVPTQFPAAASAVFGTLSPGL